MTRSRRMVMGSWAGLSVVLGLLWGGCDSIGGIAPRGDSSGRELGDQDLLISFDKDPSSGFVASAKTPDGSELAIFGDKDAAGMTRSVSQIDLKLGGDGRNVSVQLDEQGRPVRLEADDGSEATIVYDNDIGSVRVEVVNPSGVNVVDESVITVADAGVVVDDGFDSDARGPVGDLCASLRGFQDVFDEFFDCGADADRALCRGPIARAASSIQDLCRLDAVTVDGLATSLGFVRNKIPLGVRPHLTTRPAPGEATTVVLTATVFGGAPPYETVSWSFLVGPEEVPVDNAPGGTAVADIVIPGRYVFRVDVADAGDGRATADIELDTEGLPLVIIALMPETPDVGRVVHFSGAETPQPPGDPIRFFHWQFGDGTANTGIEVTHAYTEAGEYPVTLLVVTGNGRRATASRIVPVGGPAECERRCHDQAEKVFEECMEEVGNVEECEALVREFLERCLGECAHPWQCERRCHDQAEKVFEECMEEVGNIEECEALVREFLERCLGECMHPWECERRCHDQAKNVFDECMEEVGNIEECEALVREFLERCLGECMHPWECERRCHDQAEKVFEECMEEVGNIEECEALVREFLERCLGECMHPWECERRCHNLGERVFEECMADVDNIEECEALSFEALETCLQQECG